MRPTSGAHRGAAHDTDPVQARISYFGNRDARILTATGGAFLPHRQEQSHLVNKDEIAVYPDASADGKSKVLEQALPEESAAMRGMED